MAKQAGNYGGRPKEIDREKVLELLIGGMSIRKTAAVLGVPFSTVQKIKTNDN